MNTNVHILNIQRLINLYKYFTKYLPKFPVRFEFTGDEERYSSKLRNIAVVLCLFSTLKTKVCFNIFLNIYRTQHSNIVNKVFNSRI